MSTESIQELYKAFDHVLKSKQAQETGIQSRYKINQLRNSTLAVERVKRTHQLQLTYNEIKKV